MDPDHKKLLLFVVAIPVCGGLFHVANVAGTDSSAAAMIAGAGAAAVLFLWWVMD
jgi:hypothetical protein